MFLLQPWHSISITVDVCLLIKCHRSLSEPLKMLKMSSGVTAQHAVTCCIFYVTTRLLFTRTHRVDKCFNIVKVSNISTSFPGLRSFYFQDKLARVAFSHSNKTKKCLWDGSKEKTQGQFPTLTQPEHLPTQTGHLQDKHQFHQKPLCCRW